MNDFEKAMTMNILKAMAIKWTIIIVATKLARRAVKRMGES